MGKRGPRPAPTTLKILHGRPVTNADEPTPDALRTMPPAPDHLGDAGRQRWQEDGARLVALGVLTDVDLPAFGLYCEAWDEVAECNKSLADGAYITTNSGYLSPHPALARRKAALERIRRYQAEFGMTPSSRSGVAGKKPTGGRVAARKRA